MLYVHVHVMNIVIYQFMQLHNYNCVQDQLMLDSHECVSDMIYVYYTYDASHLCCLLYSLRGGGGFI